MSWQSYPYMASQGMCRANAGQITAQVTGCRNFAVASEEDLKQTLAQVGPLSIGKYNTISNPSSNRCYQTLVQHYTSGEAKLYR